MPYAAESFERLFNSMNNATNTYVGIYDKQKEAQAKYDLTNMQIMLERQANDTLSELQKNNNYENWEADMDKFFNNIAGNLENKDSPYYVKNNYTARAAQTMLENARNDYQAKVKQLADVKIRELNISRYNESLETLSTLYSGQELIDQRNNLSKMLYENGDISPEQYSSEIEKNWYIGTMTNYTSNFSDDLVNKAIADGKDFNETWDEYERSLEKTKRYGVDGLEILTSDKDIKEKAKQECEQKYKAFLYRIQTKNQEAIGNNINRLWVDITKLMTGDTSIDLDNLYYRVNTGNSYNDTMTGNKLATGQREKNTDEYKSMITTINAIEKAAKSGSGSSSTASYKTIIENTPDTFLQAYHDGNFNDLYEASAALQNAVNEVFISNDEWTETKHLTEEEAKRWQIENYSKFGKVKLLNSKTLNQIIDTEYPTLSTKFGLLKKDIENDIKNNPDPTKRKYATNSMEIMAELVLDIAASTGKETDKESQIKLYNQMMNACTVSALDNLFKPQGKGIFAESNDRYIARTAKELQDNDVVFTNIEGVERWAPNSKDKVDEVAKQQKSWLESALGLTLSEPQYRKVKNDIEPIPEFKSSDGIIYHIESEDGRNPVVKDQYGNIIDVMTIKQKRNEDKIAKQNSSKEIENAYSRLNDYDTTKETKTKEAILGAETLPSVVKNIGVVKEFDWNMSKGDISTRRILLNDTANKIDSMVKSKKISDEEFKKKVGMTKEEWKNMKDEVKRAEYLATKVFD